MPAAPEAPNQRAPWPSARFNTLSASARPPRGPSALGFEPKKEEIKKMIADIDKDGR